jgi:hypothetical protein
MSEYQKFNLYDLGQVAKHLKVNRGPKFTREILGKPGEASPYDLSKIRIKKNW